MLSIGGYDFIFSLGVKRLCEYTRLTRAGVVLIVGFAKQPGVGI